MFELNANEDAYASTTTKGKVSYSNRNVSEAERKNFGDDYYGEDNDDNNDPSDPSVKGLIDALVIDSKNRTTGLGLIQEDFPSTPSSVFSSRLLAANKIYGSDNISDLDSATLAMQNLYVASEGDSTTDNKASAGQPQISPTNTQGQIRTSPRPMQVGQQQQFAQQIQYVSVDGSPLSQAQQQALQVQNGQQAYYIQQQQQPVYLDQNGQPIYYRVASNPNQVQYPQEMMYAPSADVQSAGYPQYQYNQGGQYAGMQIGRGQVQYGQQLGMQGVRNNDPDMFHVSPRDLGRGVMGQDRGMRGNDRGMQGGNDRGYDNRNGLRDGRGGNDRYGSRNVQGGGGQIIQNGSNTVNPMRDPLVDEFRSTYGKSRQWGLVDLIGHVVAFCQDQHGSRFIQQRLEVCTDADKQLIFNEIIPSAHLLMTDVFGNYVLQKLFEYGTPDQCEGLAALLSGQSVQLSMQMYGCRVVQKALEYVSTPRLISLVSAFESPPVLLRCVHDSNGNHVIQKCIEIVSRVAKETQAPEVSEYLSSRIQFIIDTFKGRVKELSSHPYGCRVVQRILEHCSNAQKTAVLEELRECCSELVQDCYGNYVIQFVMQHGWEADRQVLIREVQTNLLDFSQHKFASNVVEKCLQYANKRDRDEMIWTIINVTFDLNSPVDAKTGHCVLESMVRDPYANYVVQKVIDVSDERQRSAIMRYVRENIVQLRRYTYGKHIIVRLEKITNEKF